MLFRSVEVEPDEPITTEKLMEAYVDGRVKIDDRWIRVFDPKRNGKLTDTGGTK